MADAVIEANQGAESDSAANYVAEDAETEATDIEEVADAE